MKVIILAGGLGTRLSEVTERIPKPMVEIGDRPILWHIMKTFQTHGFGEFIVALGHKGEIVKDFFLNYRQHASSMTISLKDGTAKYYDEHAEDWTVHLLETGNHSMTGGRVKRALEHANGPCFMTYGDGVCDIDLKKLLAFHKSHGKKATISAVRPPARFGALQMEGDKITSFAEKPQTGEGWINGGYCILEADVADYIEGDETIFERAPLERLAKEGELMAYKHEGFWQCMDTMRDLKYLSALWDAGSAPWKTW
ncbi:MAG: glucose-1-phosphate cytidylyltransferase [Elusimicrobia bacterium]|nr:MAG: glucose-1-phosphate cytidylyltransferase [Elusimicrobiota bacterium]